MLGTADEPIRVLRVIARLNIGGPSLHVSYLTEGLAHRGYSTTLAAGAVSDGEASMAYVAEQRGVDVEPIPGLKREISPTDDVRVIAHLVGLIRRDRPHILHTHTAKAGTVGRLAARLVGPHRPPVVVHTFHGHTLAGYFRQATQEAYRQIERGLARNTDALVAVSPEVRDELVGLGVAPASRFAVIRLGVDISERMAGASDGAALRESLGIPPDRFCVGWVARMTAVKQPEDVLGTLRALRNRGVDAALILIGDGPERDGMEERAKQLGLVEGVHFVGFQNNVGPWFHAFDVLLLPSRSEGTPVSVIETLASGRPVVATDVGGTRDVVDEGVSGFLVPFGDVEAGAERLERLARDRALRDRMGSAGQARTLERYRVPRLVEDIDRLYRALLQSKGLKVTAGGNAVATKRGLG